ncbi:MAG: hypothetical protein LUG89_00735 [Methanosphaera sp.]|nr:hypothetical protein [Methanosphaera sp.]
MKCNNCNYENHSNTTHCINCGAKLPKEDKTEEKQFQEIILPLNNNPKDNTDKNTVINQIKQETFKKADHNENEYFTVEYRGPTGFEEPKGFGKEFKKIQVEEAQKQQQTNQNKYNPYDKQQVNSNQNSTNVNYGGFEYPKRKKNVWLAVILNILIVGVGHIYLGAYSRGLFFMILAAILQICIFYIDITLGYIISIIFITCQVIDVYITGNKINSKL